jgi:hypothetical protein
MDGVSGKEEKAEYSYNTDTHRISITRDARSPDELPEGMLEVIEKYKLEVDYGE